MAQININGATFEGTAQECAQFMAFIGAMNTSMVAQTTNNAKVSTVAQTTTEKKPYVATKDFSPKYKVSEQTGTCGTKLFCISRDNGWTRSEKSLMNNAIKALKGIKEIEVEIEKDGQKRRFKAWGYSTESTAKKHLKELPTVFTVAQLNGEA